MNRRGFLRMLGIGVAAAPVLASVPIERSLSPTTYWEGTTVLRRNAPTREDVTTMFQLFESPETMKAVNEAGYKVNVEELFHMVHDVSGWKNYYEIIKPLLRR